MNKQVCFVGNKPHVIVYADILNSDPMLDVSRKETAGDALVSIAFGSLDLFVIDSLAGAGDMALPKGVKLGDTVEIGCHFIREAKDSGYLHPETPFLVTHTGFFNGTPEQEAKRRYVAVGASLVRPYSVDDLRREIYSHLGLDQQAD